MLTAQLSTSGSDGHLPVPSVQGRATPHRDAPRQRPGAAPHAVRLQAPARRPTLCCMSCAARAGRRYPRHLCLQPGDKRVCDFTLEDSVGSESLPLASRLAARPGTSACAHLSTWARGGPRHPAPACAHRCLGQPGQPSHSHLACTPSTIHPTIIVRGPMPRTMRRVAAYYASHIVDEWRGPSGTTYYLVKWRGGLASLSGCSAVGLLKWLF